MGLYKHTFDIHTFIRDINARDWKNGLGASVYIEEIPPPAIRLTIDDARSIQEAEDRRAHRTPFAQEVRAFYGSRVKEALKS